MKTITIFIIGLVFLAVIGGFNYFFSDKKAEPTKQYTQPIGPTQEYPYQLESELAEGVERNG